MSSSLRFSYALPARLVNAIAFSGHWDGICRIDTDPEPEQPSDLTGLKNTVAALRDEKRALKNQLTEVNNQFENFRSQYEGIDITAAKTAIETLPTLQQQLADSQAAIANLTLDTQLNNAVAAVVPKYRPFVATHLRTQVTLNDKGEVTGPDGKSLQDLIGAVREATPEFFLTDQPIGMGEQPQSASSGPAATPASMVVNGIVRGVDPKDVATGKVKLVS